MIGYYNRSVIVTYASVAVALFGMILAAQGHLLWAVLCLMVCGFFDVIDGRIARACNRTPVEQMNGIQLDSLADTVCFAVFPVVFAYFAGLDEWWYAPFLVIYPVAGIGRLCYYNVQAELKEQEGAAVTAFEGTPITSITLVLPLAYACHAVLGTWFPPFLALVLLVMTYLFLCGRQFRKHPGKARVFAVFLIAAVGFVLAVLSG